MGRPRQTGLQILQRNQTICKPREVLRVTMQLDSLVVLNQGFRPLHRTWVSLNEPQIAGQITRQLSAETVTAYNLQLSQYYLGSGNNAQLVRRVMHLRPHWTQTTDSSSMFVNLKWQQTQRGYKYQRLTANQSYKEAVNHFENNNCLTNKQELFRNLEAYCTRSKIDVWQYVPPTFILNGNDDCSGTLVNLFVDFYFQHWPQTEDRTEEQNKKLLSQMKRRLRQWFSNVNEKRLFLKPPMNDVFVSRRNGASYLWILKPTFLNRGRGIQVFSDLLTLQNIISQNIEGYIEKSLTTEKPQQKQTVKTEAKQQQLIRQSDQIIQKPQSKISSSTSTAESLPNNKHRNSLNKSPTKTNTSMNLVKRISQPGSLKDTSFNQPQQDPNYYIRHLPQVPTIIRTNAFVIQKYLEKPYLIDGRKFDIRVWVLLTHDLNCHFFKEGYLRLSSEVYKQDAKNIANPFMHLTNNAVQKFATNYGGFCQGNQLGFDWFRKHLRTKDPQMNFDICLSRIKESIKMSMEAVSTKMDPFNRKYCFQIFGYDFILDEKLKPWLIEVNNNPCIQESSPLLATLLPRMLDDGFRLTIDNLFQSANYVRQASTFKVPGYSPNENMWQWLYRFPQPKKKRRTVFN